MHYLHKCINIMQFILQTLFFSYQLRIESMCLKAEFDENMSNLERSVEDMLTGGEGKSYFNYFFSIL